MVEKSIDLCSKRGDEVVELLFEKLVEPDLVLSVGSIFLKRITKVEHVADGRPVISATSDEDIPVVFQFEPNYTSFSATAMGQDGERICP